MSMLIWCLTGAAVGLGVWMIACGLRRPSLAELLIDSTPSAPSRADAPVRAGWARLGRWGVPLLASLGLPTARLRRDLAVAERDPESYLAEKTVTALAGIGTPALLGLLLAVTDTPVPAPLAVAAGTTCALACWLAPDIAVRDRARCRRGELATATSVLADLIVIALAGGAGVSGALTRAAEHGHGWAFSRIRLALHTAALRRQPPWTALADLAESTGVVELRELAASVRLAGTDGARIRTSLAAKAASLRARESTDAETEAHAATERMSMPVMGLIAGFLLMIGFPVIAHITTGF